MKYRIFGAVQDAAVDLARSVAKDIPPKLLGKKGKILSVDRITSILEQRYAVAVEMKASLKLGLIRKAVFANTFRWTLLEVGYPQEFADTATHGLAVALSKKPK